MTSKARPPHGLLHDRNFLLYIGGIVISEVGVRGTLAINLYHVFQLTESTLFVGLVGLFQLAALVLLSPLGGAVADRLDRRSLLQCTQLFSLVVSGTLAGVTLSGFVTPWMIYASVLLNTAAATFDAPARQAIIPAIVRKDQLAKAFALATPTREMALLLGPALGGVLVALGGPGLMYAVDAASYLALILILVVLRVPPITAAGEVPRMLESIRKGLGFVRRQPVIWQFLALDILAMTFGAYRVVLPELSEHVFGVGATGYGFLVAAVPLGALVGSWVVYVAIDRLRAGPVVLWALCGYGLACMALATSKMLLMAAVACLVIGATDALGSTIRNAAVQGATPDSMRGRVSSIALLAGRGGPALGDANVGLLSGVFGPAGALAIGALVPIGVAGFVGVAGEQLRTYEIPSAEDAG